MLSEVVLTLLQEIKGNIVVDTGDGIRGIEAITLTEDDKGFIFILEEPQVEEYPTNQADEPPAEPPAGLPADQVDNAVSQDSAQPSEPADQAAEQPAEQAAEPEYKCPDCGREFETAGILSTHIKKKHQN